MGIINVTPDSFSDGGSFLDPGRAVEHCLKLLSHGADILDIGGESTRPGAEPVSSAEELHRVLPVLRGLRPQTRALISIDTMKAEVARAAIDAGADIINDVTALSGDAAMIHVAAASEVGLVLMHMRGTPMTMQNAPAYTDVITEVRQFFERRLRILADAGIHLDRVALDPGFGFGKTVEHNLQLVRRLPELRIHDRPFLVGVSRKSMLARITGQNDINDRLWPTVALTSRLRELGATIHRVHDVAANAQALRMTEAIMDSE